MPSPPPPQTAIAGPLELAQQLEELESKLAQTLRQASEPAVRELLETCPQGIESTCSALRDFAETFEANRADALLKKEQELDFLVSGIGEGLRDLGEANQRVAKKVGGQVEELDAIGDLPPSQDVVAHLRGITVRMQEATQEMQEYLDSMAEQVRTASQRIADLQAGPQGPKKPDLYDSETRLYSRAALVERLRTALVAGAARGPWSLLVADIDHLGDINERFGRLVGDALLFKIARIIEERLQKKCPTAFLARYDGGQFGAIVAGKPDHAADVAEHLRKGVAAARWQYRGKEEEAVLETTISVGLAPYRRGDTSDSLMQRAEKVLRQAKDQGRDRVATAEA
ncbi:MAG: GGDEF domain-containing protein [Candidatus Brocadiia bacterium]